MGSKTPMYCDVSAGTHFLSATTRLICGVAAVGFRFIFNELQAIPSHASKRVVGPVHHVPKGHAADRRGARFGPDFVTIQPTGVCVCSI
jgi:hypothetical protein